MDGRERSSLALDLLGGAAAGALGTWLMSPASSLVSKRQSEADRQTERESAFERNATELAALRVARLFGVRLRGERLKRAGLAVHWLNGISLGVVFALVRRRFGGRPLRAGLLFGAALWLFGDELAVPRLGLSPKAYRFPVSTHVKALSAHLAYGAGVGIAELGLSGARSG